MFFNEVYFSPQVQKERDQVAAERGDLSALIRFNYKHEEISHLKELERWGVKLKYLPIADMCVKQNKMNDAEHFLQMAYQNKEENAAYKFALFWEMAGNREKAIEKLMEVYQTPKEKCYLSACQRLRTKYQVKIQMPQEIVDKEKKVRDSVLDMSEHPFSQSPVRYIVWYVMLGIAGFMALFVSIIFAIPFAITIYLFRKNRYRKPMLEWEDLQSEYLDYCNEFGQEYKDDPDLGPVNADDAENEPKQRDYQKTVLGCDGVEFKDDEEAYAKALAQHRIDRDELTKKIHHIKMNHLIQRFYKGEKWLMPILVIMYHLKFDGEKFIGDAYGQADFPIVSMDMTKSSTLKEADEPLQGTCFYSDQI